MVLKGFSVATEIPLELNLSIPQHWIETHQRVHDHQHRCTDNPRAQFIYVLSLRNWFSFHDYPLARWAYQVDHLAPLVKGIPESQDRFGTVESQIADPLVNSHEVCWIRQQPGTVYLCIAIRYNYKLRLLHSSVYDAISGTLCYCHL